MVPARGAIGKESYFRGFRSQGVSSEPEIDRHQAYVEGTRVVVKLGFSQVPRCPMSCGSEGSRAITPNRLGQMQEGTTEQRER